MPTLQFNGATYEVDTWRVIYDADTAPPIDGTPPPLDTPPGWTMDIISTNHIPGMNKGRWGTFGWQYGAHIFGAIGNIVDVKKEYIVVGENKGEKFVYKIESQERVAILKRRDTIPFTSSRQIPASALT